MGRSSDGAADWSSLDEAAAGSTLDGPTTGSSSDEPAMGALGDHTPCGAILHPTQAAAAGSSTKRIRATEIEDTIVGLIGARVSMEFHRFLIFPIAVGNDI